MFTSRFYSFLVAIAVFYFLANQTQTGWLYVITALLVGVVIAGFWLNRRSLQTVHGRRNITMPPDETIHEGDPLSIGLSLQSTKSASHLKVTESCPFASPDSPEYELNMFVPELSGEIHFDYDTIVDRRGLHRYPPLKLESRAPFGFFRRHGEIIIETPLLVYPELRKLDHFLLLDRQPSAQLTQSRAGIGTEIMGVRPYRTGDSPRHVHWRSTARRGTLISKEFAEETQPGMSLVLDRYFPLSPLPKTKHTPFEMAVKCAASMGEYALRKRYPLYLVADQTDFAVPQSALVWDSLMQYLARIEPQTVYRLPDLLSYQSLQPYVAVALSWADDRVIESLVALKHRGYHVFVAVTDPASFPIDSPISGQGIVDSLMNQDILARLIRHGEDWSEGLAG